MAGAGALGFGGGFAQGFMQALMEKRARRQEDERYAQQRSDREFQMLFPVMFKEAQESGDFSGLEQWMAQYEPDFAKKAKKEGGSPFSKLAAILSGGMVKAPHDKYPGGTPPYVSDEEAVRYGEAAARERAMSKRGPMVPTTPEEQAKIPGMPTTIELPQRPTFMGVEMASPEERRRRLSQMKLDELIATVSARRGVASTLGLSPDETKEYAATGDYTSARARLGTTPQPGTLGAQILLINEERAAKGLPPLTSAEVGEERKKWEALNDQNRAGTALESAAQAMGYTRFADVPVPERAAVVAKAEEMAQSLREAGAYGAGTGTGRAAFEKPVDVKTSQDTQVPVGTSSADFAGQVVPTTADRERSRGLEVVRTDLQRLLGDAKTPGLLSVLPSKNELGGLAPGASLALRRRNNEYRERIAQLESVVDTTVNVLARTRGEQRGAQTEKDAERAYNAIVQLQAGLSDPLGGDTQESAAARIKEAMAGLDRVLAGLPKTPVAKPGSKPAASASPPAGRSKAVMGPDGKWYIQPPQ